LMRRGAAHERAGQHERAGADFAEVVRLDPGNAEARSRLGYVHACRKAHAEAQREASEALWRGSGDYLLLPNVACIYARLSESDEDRAAGHQDTAIALLRRAVELWKGGGRGGPSEVDLIRTEPAFPPSLRARPNFNKLLEGGD